MTETEKIKRLQDQGLIVQVLDPTAEKFNHKYTVFTDLPPLGKRIVMINEDGAIIGRQG